MDLNVAPYFDDGVAQFTEKDYKQLLYNPGVPVQARELTQNQTLAYQQSKANFDMIYKDGSIIEGCVLTTDPDNFIAHITEGKYYYSGRIYSIAGASIAIAAVGSQLLGFQLIEEIITAEDDTALNDPSAGHPNYNLPGSDRLKQVWSFVNITEDNPTIFKEFWNLEDGLVIQQNEQSEYSVILDTIARRTFDESGHYLVNGLELYVDDYDEDISTDFIKLLVGPGKAYVQGYEVNFAYPHFEGVPKSQTFTDKLNENHLFSSGTAAYDLRQLYVKTVDTSINVSGLVHVSQLAVNHVAINGTDAIGSYENIFSSSIIVSVDANETSDFTLNTDYYLTDASGEWAIDWNTGGGTEPAEGADYYVSFNYTKNMIEDTDWELINHPTDEDTFQINFLYNDLPADATTFYVDYEYYLARTDLIQIDKAGAIIVKQGDTTHWTETIVPRGNKELFPIGFVKHMPNRPASSCETYNYKFKRLTMREIYNVQTRVEDLEYNQAELALEADAKGSELPTNLKGVFVDSFETFDKMDVNHVDFKCALNQEQGELTKEVVYDLPTITPASSTLNNITLNLENYTKYASLDFLSEKATITIPFKTKVENLNPYTFVKRPGFANVDPRLDYWVDTEIEKIRRNNSVVVSNKTRTVTNTRSSWWGRGWWWGSRTTSSSSTSTSVVGTTSNTTRSVADTDISFARQIPIQIMGDNWSNNSRIDVFFDGDYIAVTPTGDTSEITDGDGTHIVVQDGTPGTSGRFTGTIMVPAGTRTGEHRITFKDIDLELATSAVFTSEGISRLITETTTVTRQLAVNRVINRTVTLPNTDRNNSGNGEGGADPISQSFVFSEGKTFTSIDLYFKSKDPTVNAWMEIGYLVNGYPSRDTVFHNQIITPADITETVDGTVASKITFLKPIYVPADTGIFITFGSKSDQYYAYVSELGEPDVATGKTVEKNPYINGVFFKSSNNITWTAFQNIDLTCTLYEGVFETSGSVETETVVTGDIGRFCFTVDDIIPIETDIKYYYSTNSGVDYKLFKNGDFLDMDDLVTSLKFKMDFTGNGKVTPMINNSTYGLTTSGFNTDADNYYVSRMVYGVPAYNTIKSVYDIFLSAGTSAVVYGSVGDDLWFPVADNPSAPVAVTEIFNRREYDVDIRKFAVLTGTITGTFLINEAVDIASWTDPDSPNWPHAGKVLDIYDSGNPGEDMVLIEMYDYANQWDQSETVTGNTSGATLPFVWDVDPLLDATEFRAKIKLNNTSVIDTPVIRNLKFIMKV